jgi:hypothetical protein
MQSKIVIVLIKLGTRDLIREAGVRFFEIACDCHHGHMTESAARQQESTPQLAQRKSVDVRRKNLRFMHEKVELLVPDPTPFSLWHPGRHLAKRAAVCDLLFFNFIHSPFRDELGH